MPEIVRCKRCNRKLSNKLSIEHGYGAKCYRIITLQKQETKPEIKSEFDMKEIKSFITLEIQKTLNKFDFSRHIMNNSNDVGIVPIRIAKMPKFNIDEVNKRLVVKELKEQLEKGIDNVLQEVGSFDDKINFLETPIEVPVNPPIMVTI